MMDGCMKALMSARMEVRKSPRVFESSFLVRMSSSASSSSSSSSLSSEREELEVGDS